MLERQGVGQLRSIARVWDNLIPIRILGRRVGLDAIIGLIPGVGDVAGGALGIYGMVVAARLGVSAPVLLRMLLNIGVDTVVGLVPLLGDLFDIGWKSNSRNLALVEQWMAEPVRTRKASLTVLGGTALAVTALVIAVVWGAGLVIGAMLNAVGW